MTAHMPVVDRATFRVRRQLGRELEAIRTLAGLSQRELQGRIGISQSCISRIENGQSNPSTDEITAWVEVTDAQHRLNRLLALNEAAHIAGSSAAGTVRGFTLVDEDDGRAHLQVRTRHVELTIISLHIIERYRDLFDQVTGSALGDGSTNVTLLDESRCS